MRSLLSFFFAFLIYNVSNAQVIVKKDPEIETMLKEVNADTRPK